MNITWKYKYFKRHYEKKKIYRKLTKIVSTEWEYPKGIYKHTLPKIRYFLSIIMWKTSISYGEQRIGLGTCWLYLILYLRWVRLNVYCSCNGILVHTEEQCIYTTVMLNTILYFLCILCNTARYKDKLKSWGFFESEDFISTFSVTLDPVSGKLWYSIFCFIWIWLDTTLVIDRSCKFQTIYWNTE